MRWEHAEDSPIKRPQADCGWFAHVLDDVRRCHEAIRAVNGEEVTSVLSGVRRARAFARHMRSVAAEAARIDPDVAPYARRLAIALERAEQKLHERYLSTLRGRIDLAGIRDVAAEIETEAEEARTRLHGMPSNPVEGPTLDSADCAM